MASGSPPPDDGRDWRRITRAASLLGIAVGTLVLLTGIAVEGPLLLVVTLAGVVPLLLGSLGLARQRWTESPGVDPSIDPMEELKRRYAAGELADDELERKVEYLLDADGRRDGAAEREREPERATR